MSTKGEDATQESVTIDKLPLPDRYKRGLHAALRVIYSMNIEGFLYVILYGSCVTGKIKLLAILICLLLRKKNWLIGSSDPSSVKT